MSNNIVTIKTRRDKLIQDLQTLLSKVEKGEINAVLALAIPNNGSEMIVVEGKDTGNLKLSDIIFQIELFKHRLLSSI